MSILGKSNKILVQYLPIQGKTYWRKYPIDTNSKVLIKQGRVGAGGATLEPTLTSKAIFHRGIFNTPYAIYPHGAKTFLERGDGTLPAFSMKGVNDYFRTEIFAQIRSAMKSTQSILIYIILAGVAINVLMSAGGFGYINL